MSKFFSIPINVVNGEVYEFAKTYSFKCESVIPIGYKLIRYFNQDMCSVAKYTYYIQYGQDLFGTDVVTNLSDFWNYTNCFPNVTFMNMNGCSVQINGRNILMN